jgi:hypothetical protein
MEMTTQQELKLQKIYLLYNKSFRLTPEKIKGIFVAGIDSVRAEERPVCTKAPHPTELKYPEQTKAFKEMLDKMYQLHLIKNEDYSPSNINGVGMIGLVTRLWDKTVRILNLSGFNIEAKFIEFRGDRKPKNESLEDTFIDLANYGVIGRLMLLGKWGK